jgi:gluconate 2-dehydrogenase gamma chain
MIMDPEFMDRRGLLSRMALLLGVASLPADALAAKPMPRKRFLTPAQFAVLTALSDTIVPVTDTPGALAAGVPAKLDGMLLRWASAETRTKISGALSRLEAVAVSKTKKSFAALSPAQRKSVLTGFDKAALKAVPPPPGAPKVNFFTPVTYVVDPGYLAVKGLVINLYYNSEIAMTKELVYEHNPGPFEPSIKATAATRPWASIGPF